MFRKALLVMAIVPLIVTGCGGKAANFEDVKSGLTKIEEKGNVKLYVAKGPKKECKYVLESGDTIICMGQSFQSYPRGTKEKEITQLKGYEMGPLNFNKKDKIKYRDYEKLVVIQMNWRDSEPGPSFVGDKDDISFRNLEDSKKSSKEIKNSYFSVTY